MCEGEHDEELTMNVELERILRDLKNHGGCFGKKSGTKGLGCYLQDGCREVEVRGSSGNQEVFEMERRDDGYYIDRKQIPLRDIINFTPAHTRNAQGLPNVKGTQTNLPLIKLKNPLSCYGL